MGLFEKTKNSPSNEEEEMPSRKVTSEEISYAVAYFVLPNYAFSDMKKIRELWKKTPEPAGAFLYFMSCQAREVEPDDAEVDSYVAQLAENKSQEFFFLEHPHPRAVDLSVAELRKSEGFGNHPVLAPYFSCVVPDKKGKNPVIYVLGQSPIGGGTTLRRITSDGNNANLGPGPEPVAAKFLEMIVKTMSREG